MLNLSGGELMLLIVLALIILGPDKLPGYAAKLGQFVRAARDMAEGARSHIREEMGPGFDEIDWQALDPRQYDPRRIVREALATGSGPQTWPEPQDSEAGRAANEAAIAAAQPGAQFTGFDPSKPVPWDAEAT